MKSAGTVSGHLARLLLLACTVLGVAALHTIGHAGLAGLAPHHPVAESAVTAAVPGDFGDFGGCDGDGCLHHAAGATDAADTSRWWDVCLAIIGVLAGAALAVRLSLRSRAGTVRTTVPSRWRPPPHPANARPTGLIQVTAVVLRT